MITTMNSCKYPEIEFISFLIFSQYQMRINKFIKIKTFSYLPTQIFFRMLPETHIIFLGLTSPCSPSEFPPVLFPEAYKFCLISWHQLIYWILLNVWTYIDHDVVKLIGLRTSVMFFQTFMFVCCVFPGIYVLMSCFPGHICSYVVFSQAYMYVCRVFSDISTKTRAVN